MPELRDPATGRLLRSFPIGNAMGGTLSLDLSDVANGIYLLVLRAEHGADRIVRIVVAR